MLAAIRRVTGPPVEGRCTWMLAKAKLVEVAEDTVTG
jgi:hypothetical protein